jgi:hypothetical protein
MRIAFVLFGVERAVGHVRDGEVLDDLAALELEVAERMRLVRRIVGTVRRSGGGEDERDDGNRNSHGFPSPGV